VPGHTSQHNRVSLGATSFHLFLVGGDAAETGRAGIDIETFRCLWAAYKHPLLLPEDMADMVRRTTTAEGGPLCVEVRVLS